jgi:glycosyltransferase involved in cell wall biosynthesis
MVLHLFNLLNAPSERTWLDVAVLLSGEFETMLGYESVAAAFETALPMEQLPRVHVTPVKSDDVFAQMDALAADGGHPLAGEVGRYELVHGHTGPRVLHAAPFLARGKPVVVSLYGYDASRLLLDPAWGARYRWAASKGARFVTLCGPMTKRLAEAGVPAGAIVEIPLGLHLSQWPFDSQVAPATPRFVFVGRLVPKKGVDDLLHALAEVNLAHRAGARLDVVGTGPLGEQLAGLVDKLDLNDVVTLHGSLPREQIAPLLHAATAFVLPSKTASDGDAEGTPIVLMEAQALGVPCVTTRHMGNPEIVPGDSPLVVAEGDRHGLAEAMWRAHRMTAEERRTLQEAGRKRVETDYDLRVTARRYGELYRSLTR